ncbi:MAG: hypothetical protein K940chlam7_02016, partial [Chlamydiae bacterium]|nr:hypothetical protein [Chlamydiota bacterium]NGX43716.1 hypothetical protein [Chlamydiota bacterium]
MIYKCKILVHNRLRWRVTFPYGEGALHCKRLWAK